MEKKELEIRKTPEELTAEDLVNVNGGSLKRFKRTCGDCPKKCGDCSDNSR